MTEINNALALCNLPGFYPSVEPCWQGPKLSDQSLSLGKPEP